MIHNAIILRIFLWLKVRMRIAIVVIMMLFLGSCAIFGPPTELDDTKGMSADRIYALASEKLSDKDYEKAIGYFKKLESRYPNGKFAAQAQLDTAYAYYKKDDPAQCVSTVDRFIKLHPNHPNLDYAYYLKGVAYFKQRGFMEKLTFQDISDRDPKVLTQSFLAFKDLLNLYPNSRYIKDATERMVYLKNKLADHELHVARHYMKLKTYVAALNRAKYVIEIYPDSNFMEEALVICISAYDSLGMEDLKEDNLRVLKQNYPNSSIFNQDKTIKKKDWWKFWDKD
jgi:outer membrane protein assembly factor BamD